MFSGKSPVKSKFPALRCGRYVTYYPFDLSFYIQQAITFIYLPEIFTLSDFEIDG
jgi:hypothetical protein